MEKHCQHTLSFRALVFRIFAVTLVAFLVGISGCSTSLPEFVRNGFKVGPNYTPPPHTPVTQKWIDEGTPRVKEGDPNLATWWDLFDDPILNNLIQRSYDKNLTVRAAGNQILAAQAARTIAVGELFPQSQAVGASITRVQVSANQGAAAAFGASAGAALAPSTILIPVGATGTTTPNSPNVSTGVGAATGGGTVGVAGGRFFTNNATSLNASWEVDFWGLFRRNVEAANATLDQSIANYDQIVVLLLANVATQYIEIRTLQKRLELARKNVAMQEPWVNKSEALFKAGTANSKPGYFQLKSNLDATKALIPPLEAALRQANNQLCVLLGMPVRDLLPELGDGTVPDPANPKERIVRIPRPKSESVVVGIQGDLLLRRPDVQAAEQALRIQSAQIGIAEAEMYPHIGINGSIGLAAGSFNQVLSKQSWTGSIGPSLTWNILNYGRLLGNVRLQNYQYQQFVAQYQNTVLTANQDAENALIAYIKSLDQAKHLQDSADSATEVNRYYAQQEKAGFLAKAFDSGALYNQLFTTINFQVSQQDAAAQAEGNTALNLILIYRAMGGGWQIRTNTAAACRPSLTPVPDDYQIPTMAPPTAEATKTDRPVFGAPTTIEKR
jgi:NodT family efflux transporter outer membrane factor (OMF) lipoprotein